jgi:hypothetical protein
MIQKNASKALKRAESVFQENPEINQSNGALTSQHSPSLLKHAVRERLSHSQIEVNRPRAS